MKISKNKFNLLVRNFLKESRDDELSDFEKAAASNIDRYGKPLSKMRQAYKESNPTIYADMSLPTTEKNKSDYPTLEDFYEEYISLASLVRQNVRSINAIYPKIAQDKYDIKRILKKLSMEEDPII